MKVFWLKHTSLSNPTLLEEDINRIVDNQEASVGEVLKAYIDLLMNCTEEQQPLFLNFLSRVLINFSSLVSYELLSKHIPNNVVLLKSVLTVVISMCFEQGLTEDHQKFSKWLLLLSLFLPEFKDSYGEIVRSLEENVVDDIDGRYINEVVGEYYFRRKEYDRAVVYFKKSYRYDMVELIGNIRSDVRNGSLVELVRDRRVNGEYIRRLDVSEDEMKALEFLGGRTKNVFFGVKSFLYFLYHLNKNYKSDLTKYTDVIEFYAGYFDDQVVYYSLFYLLNLKKYEQKFVCNNVNEIDLKLIPFVDLRDQIMNQIEKNMNKRGKKRKYTLIDENDKNMLYFINHKVFSDLKQPDKKRIKSYHQNYLSKLNKSQNCYSMILGELKSPKDLDFNIIFNLNQFNQLNQLPTPDDIFLERLFVELVNLNDWRFIKEYYSLIINNQMNNSGNTFYLSNFAVNIYHLYYTIKYSQNKHEMVLKDSENYFNSFIDNYLIDKTADVPINWKYFDIIMKIRNKEFIKVFVGLLCFSIYTLRKSNVNNSGLYLESFTRIISDYITNIVPNTSECFVHWSGKEGIVDKGLLSMLYELLKIKDVWETSNKFYLLSGDICFEKLYYKESLKNYIESIRISTNSFTDLKDESAVFEDILVRRIIHCLSIIGEFTLSAAFEQFLNKTVFEQVTIDNLKSFEVKWVRYFWKLNYLELLMYISHWNGDEEKQKIAKKQIQIPHLNHNFFNKDVRKKFIDNIKSEFLQQLYFIFCK